MSNNRQEKTIVNVLWSFLEQFLRRGSVVLVTLVLAWMLTPEDFGLVAMMTIFIAVSFAFIDGGLRSALIRKQEVNALELNSVFYTNIALATFVYVLLFVFAPFIAKFYEQSQLTELVRVAGLSIIFQSLSIVHNTVMQRKLLFKLNFKTAVPAAIISGLTAVLIAYLGGGVWAIIAQMVLHAAISTILFWRLKIWQPQLIFSFEALKPLFKFGGFMLIDVVFREVFTKIYMLVIGKLFALNVVGLYFFADKVKELVVQQLVSAIQQVTYPALSQIQDDETRLKDGFRKVVQVTVFLLFPIFVLIAALAQPLFEFLLPQKWLGATVYLQIMLLTALFVPLQALHKNILMVKSYAKLVLYLGFFESFILMLVLYLSITYGVVGILVGQLIATFFVFLIRAHFLKNAISYSYKEQLIDIMPSLFISLLMGFIVYGLSSYLDWSSFVKLTAFTIVAFSFYLGFAHVFKLNGYCIFRNMVLERLRLNR